MTTAVGAMRWNDPAINAENYLDLGSNQDDHVAAIRKWNGAIAREDYYVLALGGGHQGGSGNVVYEFGPFTSESPNWHSWGTNAAKYQKPSDSLNWRDRWNAGGEGCRDASTGRAPLSEQAYYSDGLPVSRHTYAQGSYIPELSDGSGGQAFWPVATGVWCDDGNSGTAKASSISFRTSLDIGADYDAKNIWPDATEDSRYGGSIFDPVSEKVFALHFGASSNGTVVEYDPRTKTKTTLSSGAPGLGTTGALALDPERRIIILHNTSGGGRLLVVDIDHDGRVGGDYGTVTEVNYSSGSLNSTASAIYHPNSTAFVGYDGGSTIYKMVPPSNYRGGGNGGRINSGSNWSWTAISNGPGGASPSSDSDEGGMQTRFRYISSIDAFAVIVNSAGLGVDGQKDDNFYVYKIPSNGF
jgi:hypothetical protein